MIRRNPSLQHWLSIECFRNAITRGSVETLEPDGLVAVGSQPPHRVIRVWTPGQSSCPPNWRTERYVLIYQVAQSAGFQNKPLLGVARLETVRTKKRKGATVKRGCDSAAQWCSGARPVQRI